MLFRCGAAADSLPWAKSKETCFWLQAMNTKVRPNAACSVFVTRMTRFGFHGDHVLSFPAKFHICKIYQVPSGWRDRS